MALKNGQEAVQSPEATLKVASVRQLAGVLGVSKTKAAELTKEPWFPARAADGSWSVLEVKKLYEEKERGSSAPAVVPSVNPLIAAEEARARATAVSFGGDAEVLARASDPLEVARASMRIAARELSGAVSRGSAVGVAEALESMKMTLGELRLCEAGYLDHAKDKGVLIERDVAKAVAGQLGARIVGALARLEARLSLQVEFWMADVTFRALSSEDRARKVRQWVIESSTAARQVEVNDIEKMIVAEIADRKAS